MFRNYLLVAVRSLRRNPLVSAINIAGLSIGLACCMLILLYIKDDWSYDRFNEHSQDIYRITMQILNRDGTDRARNGWTGTNYGPTFQQFVPEIKAYTRICPKDYILKKDDRVFVQRVDYTDDNFFSVFSFHVLNGNPTAALSGFQSMVLTEEAAKKYFGTTNVIGKTLELKIDSTFVPFTIAAVAKNCPLNSSIKFDILLPMKYFQAVNGPGDWLNFECSTFLLLRPHADPAAVLTKIRRVYQAETSAAAHNPGLPFTFNIADLQPLPAIHLSGREYAIDDRSDISDPTYSYILGGIAGFILLIACINFINLTVAQSQHRSKEIGIRKIVGSSRPQLIRQFLSESFMACGISFMIAIGLALLALPLFNDLTGKQLSLSWLIDGRLVEITVAFFFLTGFAAGFYPALVLSGFNPLDTLYRRFRLTGGNYLAKTLAVVQFTLAGGFIIGTFFMSQQFFFLTHKDLGYNDNDLVTVNVDASDIAASAVTAHAIPNVSASPGNSNTTNAHSQAPDVLSAASFAAVFRDRLLANPAIVAVARHNGNGRMEIAKPVAGPANPSAGASTPTSKPAASPNTPSAGAAAARPNTNAPTIMFSYEHVDENYFSTLQIPIISGRNFSPEYPADSLNSVIVNETFAREAGWANPLGQTVEFPAQHQRRTVIGVIRDFNFFRLTMNIMPQLFSIEPPGDDLEFDIRIAPLDRPATLAYIESSFKKLAPYYPFNYTFRKDDNLHAYDAQERWKQIVGFAAMFTIFISCIGLFGLTMLSTERRVKEIGIRKVLGASVAHLVRLLSTSVLLLVLLANLIAIPLAWWAVDKWLRDFAYRITLHWWVFALAVATTLLLAGLTVGARALKAALANPVDNLRVE